MQKSRSVTKPIALAPRRARAAPGRVVAAILTLGCGLAAGATVVAGDISWTIPEDGGTPRDPARIEALGPSEFRIRARAEEGEHVLKHAVSRLDLVCRNDAAAAREVTVHLDLSGDGQRTRFADTPEAGMPQRDFLFLRPPGRDWIQADGQTSGWVATVRFSAEPGETLVGLGPWYTYEDFLRYVRGLPDRPHLVKSRVGTSEGGREFWELTITDPEAPADRKRTIFWHAREHAYETYSSFAVEGLVEYLLSAAAAEVRRRNVIVLHPMTNVDGVALGHEYRAGYDYPDPFKPEAARLVRRTIDRLRPQYAVAWHNWIAPRDRDVVFYTHGERDTPSRRAWDLFTQRFPSPRSADHRWKDETTPLKYNWTGRPLSESNAHQYAAKRYGTRVWGWEMPWWRRTPGDARRSGADFARAFLATLDALDAEAPPEAQAVTVEVPRRETHEFTLRGRSHVANPFRDAALVGEFTSPSGKTIVADGFYDGGDTWRLRFAPDEVGEWRYRLRGEGVELSEVGLLRCTPSDRKGFIRPDPEHPYSFSYEDGTPFFPMGDTCYGLLDDSPIDEEKRTLYIKTRRSQRFNFVRMSVGHSQARADADPATYWAWGGTPDRPDLDRFNPAVFRKLDALLGQLKSEGMNVELLLINLYRRPFTDPASWTPERERRWLRYLMARYASSTNVFLWTVANEYETHPDGKYRLDLPSDPDWARSVARFVKSCDPYRHPVTVHPVISASAKSASPRGGFEPPWRIGEFFGDGDAVDVISQQTGHMGEGTSWDEGLGCWTGDDRHLVASLRADRRFRKPVLNTENGYEYLRGDPTSRRQVHHTDKVRRSSWRIACAGGYFAAGFHGTLGHSDAWNALDRPNRYTFRIEDEGAAAQLGLLYDYFAALPFPKLEPFEGVTGGAAVALADPGELYVVYLPSGGTARVDLRGAPGPFSARWFDPRTGRSGEPFPIDGGADRTVQAPDDKDWAISLRKERPSP
jgi:hypothetical protein